MSWSGCLIPALTIATTALKIAVDLRFVTKNRPPTWPIWPGAVTSVLKGSSTLALFHFPVTSRINQCQFIFHLAMSETMITWPAMKYHIFFLKFCQEAYSVPFGYCFQWPHWKHLTAIFTQPKHGLLIRVRQFPLKWPSPSLNTVQIRILYVQSKVGQILCYVHIYIHTIHTHILHNHIHIRTTSWLGRKLWLFASEAWRIVNPPKNLGGLTHLPACLKSQAKDLYL